MLLSEIETHLVERLTRPLPGAAAQRLFAPIPARKGWEPQLVPSGERHAAALILLFPGDEGPSFVLTVRGDDLPHHPGQVSLPGGGLDPGETHHDTALREAEEEIGVSPRDVRMIGALSSLWVIVSGFVLFPFIAIADRRPHFRPQAREVAKILEVPLAHLLDTTRIGWERQPRHGVMVRYACFHLAGHEVWGATGMVLSEFATLFDSGFAPPDVSPLVSV